MKKRSWCQSSHYSEHILIIKHQLTTKPAKTPNRIQQQAHSRPPNRQFTSYLNQTRLSISSRLSSITLSKRKGKSIKNNEWDQAQKPPFLYFSRLLNTMPIQVSHPKIHHPQETKWKYIVQRCVLQNRIRGPDHPVCSVMIMTLVLSYIHRWGLFAVDFRSVCCPCPNPFEPTLFW
jgi:hypothetical protein